MHKSRALIRFSLALFPARHNERSIRMLAGKIGEECAGQESTEQNRSPCVRGNADKRTQDQDHQDDVGDVVVPRKVVLDVFPEDRREEVLCDNGRDYRHGDRGYDGTSD